MSAFRRTNALQGDFALGPAKAGHDSSGPAEAGHYGTIVASMLTTVVSAFRRTGAFRQPGVKIAAVRPMITNNPGHVKGFSYVGLYRYSLTFCTDARRHLFADRLVVELVVQQLLRAAHEQNFAIIAYCFMPDHLHLLIEGTSDDSDGKCFIKAFKQYSGYYYAKTRRGTLWQRYGFEHVLRDDEATAEVVKYILRNPVRAGLAASVEEYPFVGSLVYELKDLISSTSG